MERLAKILTVDNKKRTATVMLLDTGSVSNVWIMPFDKDQKMPEQDNYCYVSIRGNFGAITRYWSVDDIQDNTYPELKPGERLIHGDGYILLNKKGDIGIFDRGGMDFIKVKAEEQKAIINSKNLEITTYGLPTDTIYKISIDNANGTVKISAENPNPLIGTTKIDLNKSGEIDIENKKGSMIIKTDGTIELKGIGFNLGTAVQKLVNESFQTLFNSHTHIVSSAPGTSAAPFQQMTPANLTLKTKAE